MTTTPKTLLLGLVLLGSLELQLETSFSPSIAIEMPRQMSTRFSSTPYLSTNFIVSGISRLS